MPEAKFRGECTINTARGSHTCTLTEESIVIGNHGDIALRIPLWEISKARSRRSGGLTGHKNPGIHLEYAHGVVGIYFDSDAERNKLLSLINMSM